MLYRITYAQVDLRLDLPPSSFRGASIISLSQATGLGSDCWNILKGQDPARGERRRSLAPCAQVVPGRGRSEESQEKGSRQMSPKLGSVQAFKSVNILNKLL